MNKDKFNPLGPHFTEEDHDKAQEQKQPKVKKVIIRTRFQDLTPAMLEFGNSCVKNFIHHKELNTYGDDWKDCAYGNDYLGLSGWAQLNKSGTLSVLVIQSVVKPCN